MTKAIIPAKGLGMRFLPLTKAMAKEMLPIVDKPTIQYIVKESVLLGIEDIINVAGKGKRESEDYFENNFELEGNLLKKGKFELLEKVRSSSEIELHYICLKEPKGLGHIVWTVRKFIGNEPFAVLLGDNIVRSVKPYFSQLIEKCDEKHPSIIGETGSFERIDTSLWHPQFH